MALVTASEYKAWSGLPDSYDTLIGTLIGTATAELERFLGVDSLEEATYTDEVVTGEGTTALRVKNWPVSAVTSVEYRGSGTTETVVTATSYRADPGDRPVIHALGWRWTEDVPGNYLVTYTAGYSTVPQKVKNVIFRLMDWHMKTRFTDQFSEASRGEGASNWARRAAGETLMLIEAEMGKLKPEVYV